MRRILILALCVVALMGCARKSWDEFGVKGNSLTFEAFTTSTTTAPFINGDRVHLKGTVIEAAELQDIGIDVGSVVNNRPMINFRRDVPLTRRYEFSVAGSEIHDGAPYTFLDLTVSGKRLTAIRSSPLGVFRAFAVDVENDLMVIDPIHDHNWKLHQVLLRYTGHTNTPGGHNDLPLNPNRPVSTLTTWNGLNGNSTPCVYTPRGWEQTITMVAGDTCFVAWYDNQYGQVLSGGMVVAGGDSTECVHLSAPIPTAPSWRLFRLYMDLQGRVMNTGPDNRFGAIDIHKGGVRS